MRVLPTATVTGFLNELQEIEKTGGWMGKGLMGLAVAGSLGGAGVRALKPAASLASAAKPAASQMGGALAKAQLPKGVSLPGYMGGRSSQFTDPSMKGIMP